MPCEITATEIYNGRGEFQIAPGTKTSVYEYLEANNYTVMRGDLLWDVYPLLVVKRFKDMKEDAHHTIRPISAVLSEEETKDYSDGCASIKCFCQVCHRVLDFEISMTEYKKTYGEPGANRSIEWTLSESMLEQFILNRLFSSSAKRITTILLISVFAQHGKMTSASSAEQATKFASAGYQVLLAIISC